MPPLTPEQLSSWREKILKGEHPTDDEAREIITALRAGRMTALATSSATKKSKASALAQEDLNKLFDDL